MNEIDWAFINGPKIFAPKLFESFSKTADNAKDLISKYYDEICVKNSKIHSWIWHDYERILSQINPDNSMFEEKKKIEERLNPKFEGRFKIVLVPNITNICYGRGVGYKIEEIVLPEDIQKISATNIRKKMREDGELE